MKDLKATFSDKAFLLKLVVLILCIISVIVWASCDPKFSDLEGYLKISTYEDIMMVATGSYLIIIGILVIIYLVDESDRWFEILFLFGGLLVNLIAGILEFAIGIKYNGNWVPLLGGGLMLASGIIMIFDFIRVIKS